MVPYYKILWLVFFFVSLHVEFSRRWCTLNDGTFSYYESDKNSNPNGALKASEIVCLAADTPERHGYAHTNWQNDFFFFPFPPVFSPSVSLPPHPQVWPYLWTLLRVRASLSVWHWWPRQPQGVGQVYCQGNHQIHTSVLKHEHKFSDLLLRS